MPSIFVSWSSPDAESVKKLIIRFKDLGLEIWEYGEDMPAGTDIHDEVIDVINKVQLAVICFSDQTADREWIIREVDWCYKTMKDSSKVLQRILPVWVGPHPANKIPSLLKEVNIRVFDHSDGSDATLLKLAKDVIGHLGQEAPLVLPVACLAMTKEECRDLFKKTPPNGSLTQLCQAIGMKTGTELFESLLERYGNRPEDLCPFQSGQSLASILQSALRTANQARSLEARRPLFLRWVTEDLFGAPRAETNEVRDLWSSGDSLLIVDSVSTFHTDLQRKLLSLPDPFDRSRAALLWLPPYTRHSALFESHLLGLARVVVKMQDAFHDWEGQRRRCVSFDTGTSVSLRWWLHHAFSGISDEPGPLLDNINSIRRGTASGIRLRSLLQTGSFNAGIK